MPAFTEGSMRTAVATWSSADSSTTICVGFSGVLPAASADQMTRIGSSM
jgi:hypothetical protein